VVKRDAGRVGSSPARRLFDRLAIVAASTLVIVVPLVWDAAVSSPFRTPKSTLAAAAWVVLAGVFALGGGRAAWRDPWLAPWAGAVAGALVSAPLSGATARVALAAVPLACAGLGWMAVRQLGAPRRRRLADLVIAAGVLEATLAIAFRFPAMRPGSLAAIAGGGREAWVGTFGNPGDVAVFLVLPALLATAQAIETPGRRSWLSGAALVMAAVVVATESLSGVAALLVGCAVLVGRRLAARTRVVAATALLIAAVGAVLATPLRGRVAVAVQQLHAGRWIWLGTGRAAGYAAAAGMLAAHPMTGVGYALFEANSYRFQDENTRADRARELGLVTGFGEAHDDLLQHAAETGLIGLALLIAGVWLAVRLGRGGPLVEAPWMPLLAAAGVLALLQFPLHLAAIAAQWAVIAALAIPPPPAPAPLADTPGRFRAAAVVALVVAAVAVAWRRHDAELALQQGRILAGTLRRVPDRRLAGEVARRAVDGLDRHRFWLPYSWDLEVTAGNLAMEGGEPAAALRRFRAALALADRPEIRFDVGMALLASGDRDGGLDELDHAVRLNPAILGTIADGGVRSAVLARLGADGYLARHPWVARLPAAR
jgi:O-antigen ligase